MIIHMQIIEITCLNKRTFLNASVTVLIDFSQGYSVALVSAV